LDAAEKLAAALASLKHAAVIEQSMLIVAGKLDVQCADAAPKKGTNP
jgi:hypothetical protein